MNNKYYFYDNEYYSIKEISEMYRKLNPSLKKEFKDSISHFILLEILKKCNYDERYIELIESLAGIEASLIDMYGADCGTPMLALRGMYNRNLKKLINLTGKLVTRDDDRINRFENGEWLLNNLVCLTIGSSFEKDIIDDLFLIDYNTLTEEECLAISDNFIRNMRDEEIVFYDISRKIK